jgi:single-strand DNA-binding protein
MTYEAIGKLYRKFATESKSASFQAREFVIETNDNNYQQYIKFQLTQDKCALIDSIEEGTEVKVYFDLRGREWNEKFFTNLNAWKVEALSPSASTEGSAGMDEDFFANADPFASEEGSLSDLSGEDDLPF